MKTVMSRTLREEAARLRLVCCCEDCSHFVPDGGAEGTGACDLLYPTLPHRRATFDGANDGEPVSFCKMFEVEDEPGFDTGAGPVAEAGASRAAP